MIKYLCHRRIDIEDTLMYWGYFSLAKDNITMHNYVELLSSIAEKQPKEIWRAGFKKTQKSKIFVNNHFLVKPQKLWNNLLNNPECYSITQNNYKYTIERYVVNDSNMVKIEMDIEFDDCINIGADKVFQFILKIKQKYDKIFPGILLEDMYNNIVYKDKNTINKTFNHVIFEYYLNKDPKLSIDKLQKYKEGITDFIDAAFSNPLYHPLLHSVLNEYIEKSYTLKYERKIYYTLSELILIRRFKLNDIEKIAVLTYLRAAGKYMNAEIRYSKLFKEFTGVEYDKNLMNKFSSIDRPEFKRICKNKEMEIDEKLYILSIKYSLLYKN